ncbi:glycosyltransferase family 2 protein [Pseudarthrobacter sp. S9]|uniref:glycosyltransferase family 2 protein n=1 Tax=Pseudarthrobacter sp. S9 TaxID=3418421 RepID=UPI003CFD2BAB
MPQGHHTEAVSSEEVPAVSVVVPIFNAMPYLRELLDSLAAQDLDATEFEVFLVDDGSTDGGSDYMDEFASRHANVTVVHQENHGWPGQPRNLGIASTNGRYLFFADADDVLAPQALRELVAFADTHGSDVVIPSMAGTHGRIVPPWLYVKTDIDVALPKAFKTLAPQKLYRRSLLADNDILFPEEKVRLEDGIFNAEAYLAAKRISVLGGETLYFLRNRDDGQNISSSGFEPAGYTGSVASICAVVVAAGLDPDVTADVLAGLYRRKCLKIYAPGRFERYSPKRRRAWLDAHGEFIDRFIPVSVENLLPEPYRSRSALARRKDVNALLDLGRNEGRPRLTAAFWGGRYVEDGALELFFEASVVGRFEMPDLVCEIRPRDGNGLIAVPVQRDRRIETVYSKAGLFRALLTPEALNAMRAGTHDFFLTTYINKKYVTARVRRPESSGLPITDSRMHFYGTVQGNLSLSISN